ncbi:MAG: PAS domain-containing protein, partial [Desulfobacterales bacterium]|nr:PAS domain-containing protein [Desulfobacterales bacterium]
TGEVYWNPRCYTMLGYAPDEFPMSIDTWFELVHPDDREVAWPKVQRKLEGEGGSFEIEFRYRSKEDSWRWVIGRGRPSQWDAQGRVLRVVGTHVDITERKEMAQQLQQSQKLEAIGTLTGGIAHDFNNILSIIIGNAELALDDLQTWHPVHHHLNEIKLAGLRAKDVVRQLLSFSRKTEQRKKPIHIQEIIEESLQLMRATIPTTIDIRSAAAPDLRVIEADPTQIHQIVINLCTNAAHAMEKNGGILDVRLSNVRLDETAAALHHCLSPGDHVRLRVSDTGCGIDPKIKNRVFDPYFTTKESGKGSGIGLSVVHGIVRDHNGAIAIDSKLGAGTTVTVLFPAIEAIPVKEPAAQRRLLTGTEKILFVDDEPSLVTMVKMALERLGYRVESATDPLQALALLQGAPDGIDLLITDMTMPKMTGTQLIAQALALRPDLPTILCTGYSEKINAHRAKELGIGCYLEKPFRPNDLAEAVRKVLDTTVQKAESNPKTAKE